MKYCPKCERTKQFSKFDRNRNRKGGFAGWCKVCHGKAAKAYRQTKKGKAAIKRYDQSEKGRATSKRFAQSNNGRALANRMRQTEKAKIAQRRAKRMYRKRHPEKVRARNAVSRAIRAKKLPPAKTSECVYCGEQAYGWHHWAGYEKEHQLDIIPLCQKCDHEAHKGVA